MVFVLSARAELCFSEADNDDLVTIYVRQKGFVLL